MTPPKQKQILLTTAFAQSLIDYLKQRPYVEVQDLIAGIIRAPFAEVIPKPEETKE